MKFVQRWWLAPLAPIVLVLCFFAARPARAPAPGGLVGGYAPPQLLNGATVPAAGALTAGNVLQVADAGALAYGQLDLANPNSVKNVLPSSHIAVSVGSVGTQSTRPTATGSGRLFFATDRPLFWVDDPGTVAWVQFGGAEPMPSPAAVGSWTAVGSGLVLGQDGDNVLAASADNNINAALQALTVTVPYAVEVSGYQVHINGTGYPLFGACLSNGVTSGTSVLYAMLRYQGSYGFSSEHDVVGTATRTTYDAVDHASLDMEGAAGLNFRVVNDGTNLIYQVSGGTFWAEWDAQASPGSLTHYGFLVGTISPFIPPQMLVTKAKQRQLVAPAITAGSYSGGVGTFTTGTAHTMISGSSISLLGIVSSGTSPNGISNGITRIDATHFSVPNLASFTYVSGGTVLDLTQ